MRSKLIAVFGALMLSATAMQAQTGTSTTAPVDINTASRTELATAGWGEYADAIIAARPYKSMNDLVEKKVVPQKAYDKGYQKFTIGDATIPAASPNQSSTNPTATTPPVTQPTTPPTTLPAPGTTPSVTPGTTPPTVTPGTNPPTMTPGTTPTTPGAATTPAAPAPGAAASPAK